MKFLISRMPTGNFHRTFKYSNEPNVNNDQLVCRLKRNLIVEYDSLVFFLKFLWTFFMFFPESLVHFPILDQIFSKIFSFDVIGNFHCLLKISRKIKLIPKKFYLWKLSRTKIIFTTNSGVLSLGMRFLSFVKKLQLNLSFFQFNLICGEYLTS